MNIKQYRKKLIIDGFNSQFKFFKFDINNKYIKDLAEINMPNLNENKLFTKLVDESNFSNKNYEIGKCYIQDYVQPKVKFDKGYIDAINNKKVVTILSKIKNLLVNIKSDFLILDDFYFTNNKAYMNKTSCLSEHPLSNSFYSMIWNNIALNIFKLLDPNMFETDASFTSLIKQIKTLNSDVKFNMSFPNINKNHDFVLHTNVFLHYLKEVKRKLICCSEKNSFAELYLHDYIINEIKHLTLNSGEIKMNTNMKMLFDIFSFLWIFLYQTIINYLFIFDAICEYDSHQINDIFGSVDEKNNISSDVMFINQNNLFEDLNKLYLYGKDVQNYMINKSISIYSSFDIDFKYKNAINLDEKYKFKLNKFTNKDNLKKSLISIIKNNDVKTNKIICHMIIDVLSENK